MTASSQAGLSAEQLLALATALLVKRDELLRRAYRPFTDEAACAEVRDDGEVASAEDGMRVRARLGEREWLLLREVERALVKLRDGSYGICEETGEPIGYDRLAVRPWAICSVAGQEARECPPSRHGRHGRRTPSSRVSPPKAAVRTQH